MISSILLCNHPSPTQINTLSLHDALPISAGDQPVEREGLWRPQPDGQRSASEDQLGWRWIRWRWERSEEDTSELQSPCNLVCRLLLEKKKNRINNRPVLKLIR